MSAIRNAVVSAIRRTAVTAAVFAFAAIAALELGLHARHASGESMPRATFPAESPASVARPPWARAGFRDQETWRDMNPSQDAGY